MSTFLKSSIGEIVAKDYRTATVFKKHGIDFCCQGKRTVEEVCNEKQLNPELLQADVEKVINLQLKPSEDYAKWDLDALVDYIEQRHHTYVRDRVTDIMVFLEKVVRVHGKAHPELFEVDKVFKEVAQNLTSHMMKEEKILFPYIRQLVKCSQDGGALQQSPFGSVSNPIQMMMYEHTIEGDHMKQISELTDDFTPPQEACNTFKATYALLKEFQDDLFLHIHLENNIAFPKAIDLEASLNN